MTRLASVSRDPFEGLTTEYKQEKYYKENFNFLVSIYSNTAQNTHHIIFTTTYTCACIYIMQEPTGRITGTRMVQKGGLLKEEKDLCYDIPLLESLQNFMNMHVVRDQVCTYETLLT